MFKQNRYTLRAAFMLSPENGGGSGGGKSLETQLADSTAENKRLVGQVDALTRERDDAKAEVTKVTGQFTEATKTAETAQVEVKRLGSELSTVTADRDATKVKLTTAEANIARLEKLCDVKGVDKNATVPAAEETEAKGHVLDQYIAASASEKRALYSKHKVEIRAEERRRRTASQ